MRAAKEIALKQVYKELNEELKELLRRKEDLEDQIQHKNLEIGQVKKMLD
jgi:flagellar motility protein MotE (MotC chaperone)